MRELSETFMKDLMNPEGVLHPILSSVKKDQTLMLTIRDGFINIYYRGGNILRATENKRGTYGGFFDQRFNKTGQEMPITPSTMNNQNDAKEWVVALPILKSFMNEFLSKHSKNEREFQQLVARENNTSSISNESDYFISDIEVYEAFSGARFEMIAIKWPSTKRQSGNNCRMAIIEMKYGYKALDGEAGLLKHLKDIDSLITAKDRFAKLRVQTENQFNQLDQLGLLKFNREQYEGKISLDPNVKPEVIFILANYNPRASGLKGILNSPKITAYNEEQHFDLRFFVANYSGYGLYKDCMLSLSEFSRLL
ncbi:hypothetical protein ACFLXB_08210 [Chloroflexota bacterium]